MKCGSNYYRCALLVVSTCVEAHNDLLVMIGTLLYLHPYVICSSNPGLVHRIQESKVVLLCKSL